MRPTDGEVEYEWNFGDGSPTTTTHIGHIRHSFQRVGNLTLSVRIRNVLVSKTYAFPIAVYEIVSLGPITVPSGQSLIPQKSVTFKVAVATGSKVTFAWFINNKLKEVSIMSSTDITFSHSGNYKISVNASNAISWQMVEIRVHVVSPIKGKLNQTI